MVVAASVIGGFARAETQAHAITALSFLEGDSGRIIDLLSDRNGKLKAAVVEMGGFLGIGTRKIAIDWPGPRPAIECNSGC
jgi:hypothetical protein